MTKEKIQYVINAVLCTAVVVLFIMYFTCDAKSTPAQEASVKPEIQASGDLLPIATVSTDSILVHYTFAVEANERLQSQYEESVLKLDGKAKSLQKEADTFQQDYINFQKKVEAGAFMSRERAESEAAKLEKKQQQLMAKQQELENLRQQLSAEFMQNQSALAQQLQDSVQAYLNEYNADGHLHLILNEAVLMNKVAGYDITDEVIDALNARYVK